MPESIKDPASLRYRLAITQAAILKVTHCDFEHLDFQGRNRQRLPKTVKMTSMKLDLPEILHKPR